MASSQNGWPVIDSAKDHTASYTVPKTNVSLRLRVGDVATVLLWVAHYFDAYIEPVSTRKGVAGFNIPDDWSLAVRDIRGSSSVISNHASATAIDLNATRHPRGVSVSHTFSRVQIDRCHNIENWSGGVVRWGGSYVSAPPDGMHFEINKGSAAVALFAAKIRAGKVPGSWVGFPNTAPPLPVALSLEEDMPLLVKEKSNAAVFECLGTVFCRWLENPEDLVRAQGAIKNALHGSDHVYVVADGSVRTGKYGVLMGAVPPGFDGIPNIPTVVGKVAA